MCRHPLRALSPFPLLELCGPSSPLRHHAVFILRRGVATPRISTSTVKRRQLGASPGP